MSSPTPAPMPPRLPRRRSMAGPMVLISIGVIFLLGNMRWISWPALGHWFARYWPVLIIVWGIVKLFEYFRDQRQGYAARGIDGGGVVLLVFLIIFGGMATTAERLNWNAIGGEMDVDGHDLFDFMGNSYYYGQELVQELPATAKTLRVVSDHGDITVSPWDEGKVKVVVHKKVVADNQEQGNKIDEGTKPQITISGDMVTVNANTNGAGDKPVTSDLEIYLPRKAALELTGKHGDIAVRTRSGDVKASTSRGDVTLEDVTGSASVELRRGSVTANRISGDLTVDGRLSDVNVNTVGGSARFTGDFFGDMNVVKVGKAVSFKSSRTDMEMARLDGDMNMQSGDLRARGVVGPVHISTRSKDIRLDEITGDVKIDNSNGRVELSINKLGQVEVNNTKGDVHVALPASASFEVDARAHRGDIESDFSQLHIETDREEHKASGSVGSGGSKVNINNTYGNIELRKTG